MLFSESRSRVSRLIFPSLPDLTLAMPARFPRPTPRRRALSALGLSFKNLPGATMMMNSAAAATGGSNPAQSRRRVQRAFKMRGLAVQTGALDAMLNVLSRESSQSSQEVLTAVLDEIKERLMQSDRGGGGGKGGGEGRGGGGGGGGQQLVVTKSLLADVVADLSRDGGDVTEEALQLLDAFSTPRLSYDSMRKQFTLLTDRMEKRSLHGEAIHKVEMFAQRYALVQQRILKQDLFRPKLVSATSGGAGGKASSSDATHSLTPVESLLGRTGVKFLLGMVVQVEEGRYYLEDHTAQVPLDLTQASVLTDGFVTENSIVLVEGEMVDGILQVHRMGSPIIETRQDAVNTIGLQNSDIFNSLSSLSELEKLKEQELEHGEEGMFVILSDVHLDNPIVMEKLDKLFEGFQDMSPLPVFVFMGNFTSKPLSAARDGTKIMISYYQELANLICKYPSIAADGRFIFVPGPNDPGMSAMMPRPPIPNYFTSALRNKVPHAVFTTNPCRIRYFSKELVFCRQDIVSKLRRNCLLAPREDSMNDRSGNQRMIQHAVKSMLDQGHLCPLPMPFNPIYWQYDHSLRLYPLPDAVVVGDRVEQYYETYADCDAMNPGSFPSDFNFVVYRPLCIDESDGTMKSDLEFSQIED